MRLFSLTIAKPIEAAAGACRRRFTLAARLSALLIILYLAPTIATMQVLDRVVLIGGVQILLWNTVIAGLAIAPLTALDRASRAADFASGPEGVRRGSAR